MATLEDLNRIFTSFALFGNYRNLATGEADQTPLMDNTKFAKFCKDTKIIDSSKKVTITDIDILFNKVKVKQKKVLIFCLVQEERK